MSQCAVRHCDLEAQHEKAARNSKEKHVCEDHCAVK